MPRPTVAWIERLATRERRQGARDFVHGRILSPLVLGRRVILATGTPTARTNREFGTIALELTTEGNRVYRDCVTGHKGPRQPRILRKGVRGFQLVGAHPILSFVHGRRLFARPAQGCSPLNLGVDSSLVWSGSSVCIPLGGSRFELIFCTYPEAEPG